MATVYLPDGGSYDDGRPEDSPASPSAPSPQAPPPPSAFDASRVPDSVRNAPGGLAWAEQFLKNDPGDYHRMEQQFSTRNQPADAEDHAQNNLRSLGGGATPRQLPGFQFNDPYTKLYEDVARKNLESLQGQNQQFQQLMGFLNSQFQKLSNSNGYTPDEFAVLRTQALEPIEAQRQAAIKRANERTSVGGYLPSSGIAQERMGEVDRVFDQARTAAQRDIAIGGINRQRQNLADALNLAQLAVQIPDNRDAQALGVANQLYQLPRTAMADAQGVINASSPQNTISSLISLLSSQQQYGLNQQAVNQQNSYQNGALIAWLIDNIFGGDGA